MPLATLRHATRLRQAVLVLLLALQCLLAGADTLSETLSADDHHQNGAAHEIQNPDSGHSDAADACDHCCHCNGHTAHLALALSQQSLPGKRPGATAPALRDRAPNHNPSVIYRPPIA